MQLTSDIVLVVSFLSCLACSTFLCLLCPAFIVLLFVAPTSQVRFQKLARAKFGADSDVFPAESEGGSTVHRMSWPSHRAQHAQPCVHSSFKTVIRTVPTMSPNMCEQPHHHVLTLSSVSSGSLRRSSTHQPQNGIVRSPGLSAAQPHRATGVRAKCLGHDASRCFFRHHLSGTKTSHRSAHGAGR